MKNEIERKFLIKKLPSLKQKEKTSYERYYLFDKNGIELRVQRKGDKYELERKIHISAVERTKEKIEVSEEEFNLLKSLAICTIILRDSYALSSNPELTVKIYHGKYEGLARAEVKFDTVEQLEASQLPDWFGREITSTPLARDSQLLKLSEQEFKALLGGVTL